MMNKPVLERQSYEVRQINTHTLSALSESIRSLSIANYSIQTNVIEPLMKLVETMRISFADTIQKVLKLVQGIVVPMGFLLTARPVYFVEKNTPVISATSDIYLPVSKDDYGFFIIGDHKLTILNPSSSRCGRLLSSLIKRRSKIVDYDTLRKDIGSGDLNKNFKDLKRQLNANGYALDYDRPRSQGIILKGVKRLQ